MSDARVMISGALDHSTDLDWKDYTNALFYASHSHVKTRILQTGPTVESWFLNLSSGPLRKLAVRQALELAIDRANLAGRVYAGYATPDVLAIPPIYGQLQPGGYDLAAARRLLAGAGLEAALGQRRDVGGGAQRAHGELDGLVAAGKAVLAAQLLVQDARGVVNLRGALGEPCAVLVEHGGSTRLASVRQPRRLTQAASHRLAVELELTGDCRDALTGGSPLVELAARGLTRRDRGSGIPGLTVAETRASRENPRSSIPDA